MNNAIKTAVSLPSGLFRQAETLRRRAGLSRSALYAQALKAYFDFQLVREKELRYGAGYEAMPEDLDVISSATAAGAAILKKEDW